MWKWSNGLSSLVHSTLGAHCLESLLKNNNAGPPLWDNLILLAWVIRVENHWSSSDSCLMTLMIVIQTYNLNKVACPKIQTRGANPALCLSGIRVETWRRSLRQCFKGQKDKDWGREKRKALQVTKIAHTRNRGQSDDVTTGYNTGFLF